MDSHQHALRTAFARSLLVGTALAALGGVLAVVPPAEATHTPPLTSVTVPGSYQSELGCPGDWDPACPVTGLAYDSQDDVWQATFSIPAGAYEYKAALNGAWTENYGRGGVPNGANLQLALTASTPVKFYYDHETHWVTDNQNSRIAVFAGSFQSELGCAGDWDPGCLRSWLQDADGDGTYTYRTTTLPVGSYEGKVAIGEAWDENYGAGGAAGGANISFIVPAAGTETTFSFHAASNQPTVSVDPPNSPPVPADDSYATPLDTPLVIDAPGVLANDTDPDNDFMAAHVVTSPAHGTLDLAENGSFTYLPDTGYAGADAFTYRLSDNNGATSNSATVNISVSYAFTGFARPLRPEPDLAPAKAGSKVRVRFGLGGDFGLDIMAAASPRSMPIDCATLDPTGTSSPTQPLSGGLMYDTDSNTYTYRWATDRAWKGTCRQLTLTLTDGSSHRANVRFR